MLLLGNHTSTFAQSPFSCNECVPVVPPFGNMVMADSIFTGGRYKVDGVACRGCSFKNVTFEYGGGEFLFANISMSLPVQIDLKGSGKKYCNIS